MIHKQHLRVLSAIASVSLGLQFLTGCAASVALTKPSRDATRSVSVKKTVARPDDIVYAGRGQSIGAAFGLIGAAIAAAAAQGPKAQLKAAMQEGQIDLGEIVRDRFAAELAGAAIFPAVVPEGADAEVTLEIVFIGFVAPYAFSGQLKPMLGVNGTMTRPDGTVLWKKYDYVTTYNDQTPSHTLEEYLQSPHLIREAFESASRIVVGGLIKAMRAE